MQGSRICQEKKKNFAQKPLKYSEALAIVSCVMDPSRAVATDLKERI